MNFLVRAGLELYGIEKFDHRPNQILEKIKIVVSHGVRHQKLILTLAFGLKLLRMAHRDQTVLFSVNKQGRALNFAYYTQIIKLFRYERRQKPEFLPGDIFDGGVGAHENHSTRASCGRQMAGWP